MKLEGGDMQKGRLGSEGSPRPTRETTILKQKANQPPGPDKGQKQARAAEGRRGEGAGGSCRRDGKRRREGLGLDLTIDGIPSSPQSVSPQGCDKPVWDVTCHDLSPQTTPCSIIARKYWPRLLPEEQVIRQRLPQHTFQTQHVQPTLFPFSQILLFL